MSTITEALKAAKQPPKVGMDRWLDTLDKEDRDALVAAAPDTGITTRALLEIVTAAGLRIGRDKLSEWRKANGLHR